MFWAAASALNGVPSVNFTSVAQLERHHRLVLVERPLGRQPRLGLARRAQVHEGVVDRLHVRRLVGPAGVRSGLGGGRHDRAQGQGVAAAARRRCCRCLRRHRRRRAPRSSRLRLRPLPSSSLPRSVLSLRPLAIGSGLGHKKVNQKPTERKVCFWEVSALRSGHGSDTASTGHLREVRGQAGGDRRRRPAGLLGGRLPQRVDPRRGRPRRPEPGRAAAPLPLQAPAARGGARPTRPGRAGPDGRRAAAGRGDAQGPGGPGRAQRDHARGRRAARDPLRGSDVSGAPGARLLRPPLPRGAGDGHRRLRARGRPRRAATGRGLPQLRAHARRPDGRPPGAVAPGPDSVDMAEELRRYLRPLLTVDLDKELR